MESEDNIKYEQISTLFFQGNMSARAQGAKYCGTVGIKVQGYDEPTIIPDAPQILHNCVTYEELEDVGYGFSWNPVHWAMMGVSKLQQQYYNMQNAPAHHIYLSQLNVGGMNDVIQHQNALRKCVKEEVEEKGKKLVLFGCSRGAATTFVSVGISNIEILKHISLVIVEAPFDSVENVLKKSSYFANLQLNMLRNFTLYDDAQLSPISISDSFPLDVPIAFITCEVDTIVPMECTLNLINKLRERGHKHIHHLVLKYSPHSAMSVYDDEDTKAYLDFVNSLYDTYVFKGEIPK